MKNNFNIILALVGSALLYSSCKPEIFELGAIGNKADLKYTVAVSPANANDIVLTSLTPPTVVPFWVTPFGPSLKLKDTVNIPFPGTYKFVYGVTTTGGLVTDTTVVNITTIDKDAVSDPMWIKLTGGGLGNSRTWVLDLDAKGVSKYFKGPFYFGGLNTDGSEWMWDPAFKDIPWAGVSAGDYGTMTFDLVGNANFKSDNKMFPDLSGTGKYMLYPATKELSTSDAQVLHDKAQGGNVANWFARMTVKTLTDSTMQLIAKKDASNWYIYNYITKEYYDTH